MISKTKFGFWAAFLLSAILFFTPLQVEDKTGLGLDKAVHVLLFASMAVLGLKSYRTKRFRILAFLFCYTIVTEIIQELFIPHRNFDIYDIVADSLGILLALLI